MATIGMSYLMLKDDWPGVPNPNLRKPVDGWDNTVDCCVTNPTYPVGTKVWSYNDETRNPGGYTMCYMGRCDGTFAEDGSSETGVKVDFSLGAFVCSHYEGTTADGNETSVPWYIVTGDCTQSDATAEALGVVAIQCGSMNTEDNSQDGVRYGWFWVGGVSPGKVTGDLTWIYDASIETDGNVTKGRGVLLMDDGTNGISFADFSIGDATNAPCGWVIKTDS